MDDIKEHQKELKLEGDGVTRPSGIDGDGEGTPQLDSNNSRGGARTGRGVSGNVVTPGESLGGGNQYTGQSGNQLAGRIQQGLDRSGARLPQGGGSRGGRGPGNY